LLEHWSLRFQPGRQLQMGSQLLNWFVYRKTWRIGGNLKKNSAWLVEVDRVEVFTVPYLGYMNAEIQ
jgi:hypothetical protein